MAKCIHCHEEAEEADGVPGVCQAQGDGTQLYCKVSRDDCAHGGLEGATLCYRCDASPDGPRGPGETVTIDRRLALALTLLVGDYQVREASRREQLEGKLRHHPMFAGAEVGLLKKQLEGAKRREGIAEEALVYLRKAIVRAPKEMH